MENLLTTRCVEYRSLYIILTLNMQQRNILRIVHTAQIQTHTQINIMLYQVPTEICLQLTLNALSTMMNSLVSFFLLDIFNFYIRLGLFDVIHADLINT